jgi:hypothetical protein
MKMLNETQIADVWLLFADYIDKKQAEIAAERFIELLADFGASDRTFQGTTGIDPVLDQAITYYLEDNSDEEDDYDDLEF